MTTPSLGQPGLRVRAAGRLRTPTGRSTLLAVAALAWTVAYRANGPIWDRLLDDVLGMDRGARMTETVRFFGYDRP